MLLSIGVLVMCAGLAAGIIVIVLPRVGSPTPLGVFLRLSSVAGAMSVGAGTLYVVRFNGGGAVSQVMADTAVVLGPATMCLAVSAPRGRRLRVAVVLVLVVGAGVAASSALLPQDGALVVKAAALALSCAVCALLTARNRALPRSSRRVLIVTMATYALYSAGRAVTALPGLGSPAADLVFSPAGIVVAAITAMMLTGLSVALVGRPATVGTYADRRPRTAVVIGDWKLATAAYGRDRVLALLLDLRLAAREVDPSAVDAMHGVEVAHPSAVSTLSARMRDSHGWKPEEVALLTTAAPRSLRRSDRELPPSATPLAGGEVVDGGGAALPGYDAQ
ncbi:hypothetical protein [Microbacterium sp. BH-3-3-3]|uniref:hypothetical protein n=1 Tax=Microbacterium sp. BH-3-3-3 TaxID=1906742 RepID=UPI00089287DD|nr:hypothetical protein [Microbacterium sp. BH-3-3-3]AOX46435.1 hypothetical protein BJP65_12000 [Microbacterium sp. BH-3-3-3]